MRTDVRWEMEARDDDLASNRLITLYQTIHDGIHGKSGQKEPLKLQYIRTTNESVMGWVRSFFLRLRPLEASWMFAFAVDYTTI